MIAISEQLSSLTLALIAAALLAWALLSGPLTRWRVSSAMFFVAIGLLATHGPLRAVDVQLRSAALRDLADFALAVVLFTDASSVNLQRLRADWRLPARLLGIGFPLTMILGALWGVAVLPGHGFWLVALIAVIVAPTDASLGSAVVMDHRVPLRVRRTLNVESGLNDGLATPFFTLVLAQVLIETTSHGESPAKELLKVLIGVVVGAAAGFLGGAALAQTIRRGWTTPEAETLGVVGLAFLAYGGSLALSGNGFVAAFVAGLSFTAGLHSLRSDLAARVASGDDEDRAVEMSGILGMILAALVWMLFGAMLVPALDHFDWRVAMYALGSLTLVRMIPVAISLFGARLDRRSVAFIGWFGPRGLASVVFALLAYDELPASDGKLVLTAAVTVVLASVVAHGASAGPLVSALARSAPQESTEA